MTALRNKFREFMEIKNLSPRTIESYLTAVAKLALHFGKSPELITQEMIYQYILCLKRSGKAFSTCNVALSAFKCFYNQFLGNGTIKFMVPSRRGPKKLPTVYSQEEVNRIIQSVRSPKYRLAYMTAYGSGLRLGELLNLKVSDIDSDCMTIVVRSGKGNKDRRALLPKALLSELKSYYQLFRPETWLFFSTNKNKKLCRDSISKAFKEAKRKAGVTKAGGIHTLRHCFATHLLEAGVDIKTLQYLLGHADIASTMVYLHVTHTLVSSVVSPLDATPNNAVGPFTKCEIEKKRATMSKPTYEVADIVSIFTHDKENMTRLTVTQKRILEDIHFCRTVGMGGHSSQCDACRHIEISYNSCRNRHCPKCQSLAKAKWLDARKEDLLPVRYCHAVFTLPHELNDLVRYNKKVALDGLFNTVNQTLKSVSENPKHGLVGQLGFTLVLHTWDQRMNSHFHLHCVIPAGVYDKESADWRDAKYKFLFPVKALSQVFKGKYVSFLRKAYQNGKLGFPVPIKSLGKQKAFSDLLSAIMRKDWVVYAKPPFKSPAKVLDYLGQYTHKVAIGNHRITGVSKEEVTFSYKDRDFKKKRYSFQVRTCHLNAEKFIRRFLLHELPMGFTRIRHYGFMGNNAKGKQLTEIRKSIGVSGKKEESTSRETDTRRLMLALTGIDIASCPKCKVGKLIKIEEFDGVYRRNRYWGRSSPSPAV